MNFKPISIWKVPNKTFLNLDLESWKLVLNFDLSLIWEILEFGTKVLIRIREVQFLNKNCLTYSFFRYWKRVEAGLVDKELYASWLGSVNFDAISKLICGPSSRVIYALFALHTVRTTTRNLFFFCHNQMSFKSNHVSFWTSTLSKAVLLEGTMTKQILDSLNTKTCSEY